MLTISSQTQKEATVPDHEGRGDLSFVIDPDRGKEWTQAFKARSSHFPFRHAPSPDEVEAEAASFAEDIQQTNEKVLRRRHPAHPKASPWWNAACAIATQTLRNAHDAGSRSLAHARLKGTVRAAKRKWADKYIKQAQLWDVAAWRHG